MRNIWKGTDCTSLPRNLWYSNRKWKCIDDDFASSFCKIGIDCAFTISSTKSIPLLFLSFEYSADSIDSRWLLKKISEISVRRASLPIPRAVVVYSSQSFAKFHSRFDAHFSIVWFSRGENRNSNVLPVLIPARKKERDEWKTDTNVSIYCPGLIKVRQQAIDTFRFVLFFFSSVSFPPLDSGRFGATIRLTGRLIRTRDSREGVLFFFSSFFFFLRSKRGESTPKKRVNDIEITCHCFSDEKKKKNEFSIRTVNYRETTH